MKEIKFKDKYPLFVFEVLKTQTSKKGVEEILNYLKKRVEEHPVATFIGFFDHYTHTKSLEEGKVDPTILDAKNIIFCFGKELLKPEVLGVRPRSIGVVELEDRFVLSFLEAPNPQANLAMQEWVKGV